MQVLLLPQGIDRVQLTHYNKLVLAKQLLEVALAEQLVLELEQVVGFLPICILF